MKAGVWFAGLGTGFALCAGIVGWIGDGGGVFRFDETPSGGASDRSEALDFPMTRTDALGYEVTIPAPPRSIASQALVTDHLLFGVVPHSRIVAVSTYAGQALYSNVANRVQALGLPAVFGPEMIVAVAPDLLISSHISDPQFLRVVRASGLRTYAMQTMFSTLQDIVGALRLVGALSGEPERAQRAIERFEASLNEAKRRVAPNSIPQRVLGISHSYDSYGEGSLFEDIVKTLGSVNVGSEQGLGPWQRIGSEQVAAWNPDWIVTGTGGQPRDEVLDSLGADPAIAVTTAGQRNQLVVVEDRHFLAMSQHVLGMVHAISYALSGQHRPRP